MNEAYLLDKSLQFIKEGDGDTVFIFSPFYPFNYKLVKKFFSHIKFNNHQFIYSSLNTVKNLNIELYNYNNFYNLYSRVINLLSNKKINLIGLGLFANLFVQLAFMFRDKIASIILIEPDFSYVIFNKVFDSKKKPFNKKKYMINYFLENKKTKLFDDYISKINIDYIKYYYKSANEGDNKNKLRELVDHIPEKVENGFFKEKILDNILSKKNRKFILDYYKEGKSCYILKNEPISDAERLKIKKILNLTNFSTKLYVYWKIMARESWPLAQILEDFNIPLFNMSNNIYSSFVETNDNLLENLSRQFS